MNLTIQRGTKEIGGTCIELESDGFRLLLDFGMPLVSEGGSEFYMPRNKDLDQLQAVGILPSIPGIYADDANENVSSSAVLLSHAHADHSGFLRFLNPAIPIYMTQGTQALLKVSSIFPPKTPTPGNTMTVEVWKEVKIGPFEVTPYLVDHSAPDAVAFLIEGGGKRIFYTGDFRATGRKKVVYENLIKNPPKNVDYMICEGTMLDRLDEHPVLEQGLEEKLVNILRESSQPVFLFASGQNIDRLVTAYRSCKRSGRTLIIDLYSAYILDKLKPISTKNKLPQADWDFIRVKYWKGHADFLVDGGEKNFLYKIKANRVSMDELKEIAPKTLILSRDNATLRQLMKHLPRHPKPRLFWSMWNGYLTQSKHVKPYAEKNGLPIESLHTSGHATASQIKQLIEALNPGKVIPVHTFSPKGFEQLASNLRYLEDGQSLKI